MGTFEVPSSSTLALRYGFDQGEPCLGSPVWSWRRQHRRNTPTVLPPLQRNSSKDSTIEFQPDAYSFSKKALRVSSSSLPPGGAFLSGKASGTLKPLRDSFQQGPPLRSLPSWKQGWQTSISMAAPRAEAKDKDVPSTIGQISAMALDLAGPSETPAEKNLKNSNQHAEVDESGDINCNHVDDTFIEGEELGEQHWFSFADLEAQAKTLRQQAELAKPLSGSASLDARFQYAWAFGIEEMSADPEDEDDLSIVNHVPRRVRPGEHLVDPDEDVDHLDNDNDVMEITDEDLAVFTAENAVDSGFFDFLAEADDLDMFGDEEEV